MSEIKLAERIYIKQSKSKIGVGGTARDTVSETLWLPHKAENGYVELFPVMDDLERIMRLSERVPIEQFKEEYLAKEDSREVYLKLIELL